MQPIFINRLFLFLFIYVALTTKAQDTTRIISGKVIDLKTQEPISFAIINNIKTNMTVQTDERGNFKIKYDKRASVLLITKLGYSTQTINLNDAFELPLIIKLKRQSLDLSEVIVTADKPAKRLVDNTFYILDYQFINTSILLFGELSDKPMVKLINLEGKELSRFPLNDINYESLFKDCFDNVHLINKTHTNQAYVLDGKINFLNDVKRRTFDSLLRPCILNTTNDIYFEAHYNKKQTKSIFVINKATKQKSGLGIFSDEFKISMQNDEENFMYAKYGTVDNNNTMGDASADDLRAARRKDDDVNFAKRVIFSAAYIPVFMNNDTLTVFDHPNNLIHRYSLNNTQTDLQVMEYNHYKDWKPQVISDEIDHKFYTTYLHDGIITLGEINLQTGKIEKRFKLTHTFPKNIKVRNGIVYYLYRLRDSEDKMAIYSHKIN
jgi:hypothetical protein